MQLYLLALNPTDSVTCGFLPAARRMGLHVTLLTDRPQEHTAQTAPGPGGEPGAPVEVLGCDVRDAASVIARISGHRPPGAVFTNSDHLQMQAALAAEYFGLPGKDWQAALRTKDKAEMRRHLAAAGAGTVRADEITSEDDLPSRLAVLEVPFPCVVKPREGVASEDVFLAEDAAELARRCAEIRARRPGAALVVEEYLPGELHTLETVGDADRLHGLGGFRTRLSPPPYFVEQRMTYERELPAPLREAVLAQLGVLGVQLGACHTEFVVHDGRARIVEVNYRAVGDHGDLLLADQLGIPLFEYILGVHLGEPLPPELPVRRGGAARIDYPCADRAGTLTAAPAASDEDRAGVRQVYGPMRAVGERHDLHHTNRDYLGALRTTGPDQPSVDRAAEDFLAAQRWEITP
ncbi:ATP-grasp domain-containing protein [Streptomyces winkii]|uniref:ATP-grasp domain-containing protein n=1 Tax=Streptomyces winkii TaxID=3051178 RepID=UPI0028D058FE|nr:ATP-grasp domain-containing protein [Streptomyces sp. DSM 40971]